MRRNAHSSARALRAFRDAEGDDWDWAGALMVSDGLDDLKALRELVEGFLTKRSK